MSEFLLWWNEQAKVSRWVVAASVIVPVAVKLNILSVQYIYWDFREVFLKLRLWRMIAPLFITTVNYGYVFEVYMRYKYLMGLERTTFAGRQNDFIYCLFIIIALLNIGNILAKQPFLWDSFSMAIVYLWCRNNGDEMVSFMFSIQVPALWLPLLMFAVQFVIEQKVWGPVLGILAGHFYFYLSTTKDMKSLLESPLWLKNVLHRISRIGKKDNRQRGGKQETKSYGYNPYSGKAHKLD